jgi:hypothetical protein
LVLEVGWTGADCTRATDTPGDKNSMRERTIISVPKECAQADNTILPENVERMRSYVVGEGKWRMHPSVMDAMKEWNVTWGGRDNGYVDIDDVFLCGMPFDLDKTAPPLGYQGDLVLLCDSRCILLDNRISHGTQTIDLPQFSQYNN